jgi:large subunit ribosomal protein L30
MADTTSKTTRTLRVTQVRSAIGYEKKQAQVLRGIGLRRIGHTVEVRDVPSMRGMIQKVRHLVKVQE